MSNGFYGFTEKSVDVLISVNGRAEPGLLGRKILSYAGEMNGPTTRDLAHKLMLVDGDETPPTAFVSERCPELFRARGHLVRNGTWEDWLGDFTTVGSALLFGVAVDAELYGDAQWGYVINFDDNALEVYKTSMKPVAGTKVKLDRSYLAVSYYLDHLPEFELFVEGIADADF